MLKRIGILIITIISLLGLCGCKDKKFVGDSYEYGDFVYCYITKAGATKQAVSGDYIAILELTEEGQKKDVIIIPDEIEGKSVIQIGMTGLGYGYSPASNANFTRIYLPSSLKCISVHDFSGHLKSNVFFISMPDNDFFSNGGAALYDHTDFYVSSEIYTQIKSKESVYNFKKVNVEFYTDSVLYWLDTVNSINEHIYIPTNPTKEGYTFEGWYKEKECINKYDFENETFHLEEGEEILRLYAKWV